jgi:hypothetical protein
MNNRKVPALLQSKMSMADQMSMTLKREFVEGYVLKSKWMQFGETSPMLVSAQEVEKLLSFIPKKVLDLEVPEVVLLSVKPQHDSKNSVFPPHVDEDRVSVINFYIDTHEERTTFYEYTHGSQIKEQDSFVAKSGESWLLNVSVPHSVSLSFPHMRKAISFSFTNTPYEVLREALKNE